MSVKLAGKLPKDDNDNGLNRGESAFLARPFDQVVVVAYVDVTKVTIDYDGAGKSPTVKLSAVEIIDDDDQLQAVKAAFEQAHDLRVNRAPKLPTDDEALPEIGDEWPACEDCGHSRDEHTSLGICEAEDGNGDACECNEYLVLCSCGHPWGLHDSDTGECCHIDEDLTIGECDCTEFVPTRVGEATGEPREEVDPDATETGVLLLTPSTLSEVRDLQHDAGLRLVPGGAS